MKEPSLQKPASKGCLLCGVNPVQLKMNYRIGIGFGLAGVTRDGEMVWCETNEEWLKLPTLMKFENMARKESDCDWRVVIQAPLYDVTYQRQGHNLWVLVKKGMGFA